MGTFTVGAAAVSPVCSAVPQETWGIVMMSSLGEGGYTVGERQIHFRKASRTAKRVSMANLTRVVALVLGVAVVVPSVANGQDRVFIERGACPGELCGYGVWRAVADVPVRESRDVSGPIRDTIQAGELVCALTGEVHTIPGRFVVKREHGRYAPGDTIVVYTPRSEGSFLVEFDGEQFEEGLGFSPWGGSPGKRCELGAHCWGELEEELQFEWWIRVDNLSGVVGWIQGIEGLDPWIDRAVDPEFFAECDRLRSEAGGVRQR
jgi:hypothetical protein